jgi:hypothetical protein
VRFASLDFIVPIDRGLEQILPSARPAGSDTVVEALQDLQLRVREDDPLPGSQRCGFDCARLGHQLNAFLGPRPS